MSITFRKFEKCDAEKVLSMVNSREIFRFWSADKFENYPISPCELWEFYSKAPDGLIAVMAEENGETIGHLTVRFPKENEARLGFVILNNSMRSKGNGQKMIRAAIKYAFSFENIKVVTIGVIENNTPAWRCYLRCGFHYAEKCMTKYKIDGKNINCIELKYTYKA